MPDLLFIFVLLSCSAIVGYAASAVHNWGQGRKLVDLEFRVTDLERRVLAEVKARAALLSLRKQDKDRELEEWAVQQPATPAPTGSPSVGSFKDWYQSKMRGGA